MKTKLLYGKRMNGYEYIEFMRSFNWKDENGKYIFEFHNSSIGESHINKMKFEGWKYWFDRPYPFDVLDEEILITYPIYAMGRHYLYHVDKFLRENGFELLEGELWV